MLRASATIDKPISIIVASSSRLISLCSRTQLSVVDRRPTSADQRRPMAEGPYCAGHIRWPARTRMLLAATLLFLANGALCAQEQFIRHDSMRVKRQSSAQAESLLTVEWEGIQTGDHPDASVQGFIVEYRPEGEQTWTVHEGIIPYKGPNHQYRVQIPKLPTGIAYFVRIKVIGSDGTILVETPEIRARNEVISIRCEPGQVTAPRNIEVSQTGQYSLAIRWDNPECGSIGEYQIEVSGRDGYAVFDLHRQTVTQPSVSISNLLPGTTYSFRVRAVDRSRREGPWSEQQITGRTEGRAPTISTDIKSIYRTDTQVRVEWDPYPDPRLQHYEVMIIKLSDDRSESRLDRARVPPTQTSYVFGNLEPGARYVVGVIAFVEHEPRQVYKMEVTTATRTAAAWSSKPLVQARGIGKFSVHWETPRQFANQDLKGFVIEFRLPNETTWRRYGNEIEYQPSQKDYQVMIDGLKEHVFYSIRVYVVNRQGEVVAKTAEFNVGSAADASCAGQGGVPINVNTEYISETTISYTWERPSCDESYGPIEGYEYLFWNLESGRQPERPSYVSTNKVTISTLVPNSRYSFRVRARSQGGQSPWSDAIQAATTSATVPVVRTRRQAKKDVIDERNIYQLRIVLAPPKSYLAWTPLPEHRGRILKFKLSYKVSVSEQWIRMEEGPERFRCPESIADPGDYCFDLKDLEYGTQYTSDLIYRLDTGEWSSHGNPLFFILVEAGQPDMPSAPKNLQITFRTPEDAEVRWLPPLSSVRVDHYKISASVVRTGDSRTRVGEVREEKVGGMFFSHVLKDLSMDTTYNISVRGGTELGVLGPAAWEVVSTSAGQGGRAPQIDRPRVEQRGTTTNCHWAVRGEIRNIYAYQIDVRGQNDRDWKPFGSLVPQQGETRQYVQSLEGLSGNEQYFIRIRAIDRSRNDVTVSDGASFTTQCQAPTQPPTNIQIRPEDSRSVVVTWVPPERSTWGCPRVSYLIRGTQNGQPVQARVDANERSFSVEHRFPSDPNAEWRLKIQTVNSGGESRFSQEVVTQTVQEGRAAARAPRSSVINRRLRLKRALSERLGPIRIRSVCDPRTDFWCQLPSSGEDRRRGDAANEDVRQIVNQAPVDESFDTDDSDYASEYESDTASASRSFSETDGSENLQTYCRENPTTRKSEVCIRILPLLYLLRNAAPYFFESSSILRTTVGVMEGRIGGKASMFTALVSAPRVTPRGQDLFVEWQSQGTGRGVYAYRVQFRTAQGGWNPYGQVVPYVGDNQQYSQTLTGLQIGQTYHIQIQVLDRNSYVMYTSPEASARSSCSVPTKAPVNVQVDAPDASHVRVTWTPPEVSTWGCSDVNVELQVEEPPNRPPVRLDARQNTHVFDNCQSNEQWSVKLRTVNSAGQSPWSSTVAARTPPTGELIIGPNVNYRQGVPSVTWRSIEGVDDLVASYRVEYRSDSNGQWQQQSSVPYNGWQRPYSVDLADLPEGRTYQVRVSVIDHNNGVAYTSPAVSVQTASRCQPPTAAPRDLRASPLGPTQIRLTWTPLSQSEWNCDRVWYIVKYSTPRNQGFKNYTFGENNAIFDSEPFTKWSFQIQAVNPAGESRWSNIEIGQTQDSAPGPVSDLRVQASGPDTVQLSWRQPNDPNGLVTGYEITYQLLNRGMCQDVQERPVTLQSPGNSPSYTLQGLLPHSRYRITVAAKTTTAGEPVSQEITTEPAVPTGAPRSLRAEQPTEATRATISWQAPPCLDTNGEIREYEYEFRSDDKWASTDRKQGSSSTPRAVIDGLTAFTSYRVRVRAFTSKGPGPWSDEIVVRTAGSAEPTAPPLVRVIDTGASHAQLLWQAPYPPQGRIDRYKCRYAVGGTGQHQEIEFPGQTRCPPDTARTQRINVAADAELQCGRVDNLQPNQLYDFEVAAHAESGSWSPWSRPESARTSGGPVQVSSVEKVGGTANSLEVRWNVGPADQARVQGFRVVVTAMDGSGRPQSYTVDGATFRYNIEGLTANTRYNVSVQAQTQSGYHQGRDVIISTEDSRVATLLSPPRVTDEQPSSVSIEWTAPPGDQTIQNYVVEYRMNGGAWTETNAPTPARPGKQRYTATIEDLPTNSDVEVRILATGPNNRRGEPSPAANAHTKCSPPSQPPQGVRIDAPSPNDVRVAWSRPAKSTWRCDQLGVEIAYKSGNEPERVIPIAGDQTEYSFKTQANTRWSAKLRSTNQMGSSPWSEEVYLTTKPGAPEAVRNLMLTALSPNEVRVAWMAPLDQRGTIQGYDITYRLKHRLACPEEEPRDVSKQAITVYNHKDLDYTLTGLLPYSLYEVRVRARTTELGPEETKEISTEQQPPSAPPLNLQLVYTLERSLSFSWEPVECSQRHGHLTNYEYELLGQDDWAKLERQIANTTDTKVNIEGLTPFTKYIMRVKAYNSIGGGPNTENLDAMTTKADAPLPPQDLVIAQEGTDFFMVSWLPPYPPYGPHDRYKLRYQKLGAQEWIDFDFDSKDRRLTCPGVTSSPRLCYNVTGLDPGQQFRVQVATRITGGSYGPWSTVIIANTLEVLPDAPRAITLIAKSDTTLHIRWDPPEDPRGHITQYKVTVVSMEDKNAVPKSYLVDAPTVEYLIENLNPETSYNVSISAGTKRGFGPVIWTRYSTDPFKVPAVGSKPIVTPDGPNALDVEWSGVFDSKNRIKGYLIEFRRSDDPAWQEYNGVIDHDSVKRTYLKKLTGLDPDTIYMIRIKTVDQKDRISTPSPESEARTGCAPPRSPPINVNLNSPSPRQVRLGWQAPPQNTWLCSSIKFKLEYYNGTLGPRTEIDLSSSATEHLFNSMPNMKWRMRLRTENEAGHSEWTKELELATAEGAPGPVTNVEGRPTGPTSITVTWQEPKEPNGVITGYTLVYHLKSKGECPVRPGQPVQKTVRNEKQILEGLEPDSTYEIYVIAHTTLAGPQSETITVTTEEAEPTGAPTDVRSTTVSHARADFDWKQPQCELRNGKITGYEYEVEALDDWASKNAPIKGRSTVERLSLENLTPFTRYRIHVKAVNSKGAGPFSEWVEFQTSSFAPPKPTDLIEEQAFPHSIEISFLAPSPPHGVIDDYRIRHTAAKQQNYKEVRVSPTKLECSDVSKRDRLCYRVADLEPEEDYIIQVAAHTRGGDWSEWSDELKARTEVQNIPVIEVPLVVTDTKPESITLEWQGLTGDEAKHVVGYVLEYKSEAGREDWSEWNGVIKHKPRGGKYTEQVKQLSPDTEYFFRLRVVGKNDKRGAPGPDLKARTSCGKPEQAPSNIKLESVDFETVKVKWEAPSKDSWKCGNVEFVIDFVNTTSRGSIAVDPKDGNEYTFETQPGTRWEIKMRTQTVEEGERGQVSPWSEKAVLVTQGLPGEVFVTVEPQGPNSALVIWDLPSEDKDWNYGVDMTYVLTQVGGCSDKVSKQPVTKYNVQERRVLLEDLLPGSHYEVTVTPRKPPSLQSDVEPPKTTRKFETREEAPSGPPTNLRVDSRKDTELGYKWEAPECEKQNGRITQYEYELEGLDNWNKDAGKREGVTPRPNTVIDQLIPGSRYRMRVRAYTAVGHGPWSDPLEISTTGSELGPPRDLTAVQTKSREIQLTWLPPQPLRSRVTEYRIRYSPRNDDTSPIEITIPGAELNCDGYKGAAIGADSLCTTIKALSPLTTYRIQVQGRSESGTWGEWSGDYFSTTRESDDGPIGGSLKLLSAGADNLKVQWTAPAVIKTKIDTYKVYISVAHEIDQSPKEYSVAGTVTDYHFRNLEPTTPYNVTIQGLTGDNKLWFISGVFDTTDIVKGLLPWLPAPTDLHLIEKSDTMMHVTWTPPEVLNPQWRELITHYRVTIAPYDPITRITGQNRTYTVPVPGNRIKFTELDPGTIYNITVQAGTSIGYGEVLWGAYSTLETGQQHILRLKYRTPTSLWVQWDPVWGTTHRGYTLTAQAVHSVNPAVVLGTLKTVDVDATETDWKIRGLDPETIYNVTLNVKEQNVGAWGAYATLPPGWFVVRDLKSCDKTDFANSMSWEPIDEDTATHYQVRYVRTNERDAIWSEQPQKSKHDLLCPKDDCNRLCYLVFNLDKPPSDYTFQVRAYVGGAWNHWKSVGRASNNDPPEVKRSCCIVPPPYYVEHIGEEGTYWEVDISPAATDKNVSRYYVVIDERDPAGDTNWTKLTDKVTAKKQNLPYYVGGSFNQQTLSTPRKFVMGDGKVHGGYLNYPLVKGKKYNWDFFTVWKVDGKPVVGRLRASDFLVAGWPWWWLLLLLLLLLLLILLCCCLLWCLSGRYRSRTDRRRIVVNGQTPLLGEDKDKNEMAGNLRALESRIDNIRSQLDNRATSGGSIEGDIDSADYVGVQQRSEQHRRSGNRRERVEQATLTTSAASTNNTGLNTLTREELIILLGKGDFEDGYVRGFRDANKTGSASAARRRMDEDYGARDDRFHVGYVQGLRDAGMTGMTTSMHNLAVRGQPPSGGYSPGYMQGFRDGNSGIFGDRITTTLLRRLEEQYPTQDEFRQGYVDGFKEGANSRGGDKKGDGNDARLLHKSLTELTERLSSLEKTKGDEIHSTKIYHVYNQQPEVVGFSSSGQQLAHELEEMSSSRRSTLRRHYTPGDYLKYASDIDGYGSLRQNRRSLSASALGRDELYQSSSRNRYTSGTGAGSYISRGSASAADRNTDTFSRRYNYRSRSDIGPGGLATPRRYASQTLLDGSRPGPTTPHWRRDALESLQRELDTLSRSPTTTGAADRSTPIARGYASDTGYMNDTIRSRAGGAAAVGQGYSNYDYDSYQASRSHKSTTEARASSSTRGAASSPRYMAPVAPPRTRSSASSATKARGDDSTASSPADAAHSSSLSQAYNLVGLSAGAAGVDSSSSEQPTHNWPDDLMDIVQEPMGQTLDRMKKFSSSMNQVAQPDAQASASRNMENEPLLSGEGPAKESVQESYQKSYKEEYSVGR
uniref:Fibronectin type-III domain-containing protein n=1 Tax=Plectus sambesii TaxID=2011161 RepID=A0A914W0E7_9BILA